MNTEDKYILYDNIVASSVLNIKDLSKKTGMIIFDNFDPTNKKHLFLLNTAEITKLYPDIHRDIYLIMPLLKYLWFKLKYRKRYQIKRYSKFLHKSELNNIINIEKILQYMAEAYNITTNEFDEIYNTYYK